MMKTRTRKDVKEERALKQARHEDGSPDLLAWAAAADLYEERGDVAEARRMRLRAECFTPLYDYAASKGRELAEARRRPHEVMRPDHVPVVFRIGGLMRARLAPWLWMNVVIFGGAGDDVPRKRFVWSLPEPEDYSAVRYLSRRVIELIDWCAEHE